MGGSRKRPHDASTDEEEEEGVDSSREDQVIWELGGLSWYNTTEMGKNIPDENKIYQMTTRYTK
jgi:hypothetical protein